MSGFDGSLDAYLDAWRDDSRRAPSPVATERARLAMHRERNARAHARHGAAWLPAMLPLLRLRVTRLRLVLVGSSVALAGVAIVAALGWNAPAGSPLYSIRAVRQSVALSLPGADLAALHLQYAEQSLSDARNNVNVAASLGDAGSELTQARTELDGDTASPLWTRWERDETQLAGQLAEFQQQQEHESEPAGSGATQPAIPGAPSPSHEPAESSGGATEAPEGSQQPSSASTERPESSNPSLQPSSNPEPSGGTDS